MFNTYSKKAITAVSGTDRHVLGVNSKFMHFQRLSEATTTTSHIDHHASRPQLENY